MAEHDPRCEGPDGQKVLDDVAEHGWHVIKIIRAGRRAWMGLFDRIVPYFRHPEIIVFGLGSDLMQSVIDSIGDDARSGRQFEIDNQYPDLIEGHSSRPRLS